MVRALNGVVPNIRMIEGAEPKWIWYACEIMNKLRPEMEVAQEVVEYVRFIFTDEGIYFLHPYLTKDKDTADMRAHQQIYAAIKHKALNGPFPIEATSFINRQALELAKIQVYVDNQNKEINI